MSKQNASVYEAYFRQANPSGSGIINASDAAAFLKKSGLPETVLHKIWEISDSDGKGFLDKQKFQVALKMIALAQCGKEVSMKFVNAPTPPPNMGNSPLGGGGIQTSDLTSWIIKAKEKARYDELFESLKPVNGLLTGEVVKPVLLNSKLPVDVLGKIWEVSDIDHDGSLDQDEFTLAMYLVYRAIDGAEVPHVLPLNVVPPSKRYLFNTQLPSSISANNSVGYNKAPNQPLGDWVVSAPLKAAYDQKFLLLDTNKDGLVSGTEIKDILIASGLPQAVLAHIWSLCDTNNSGLLNSEQFALVMHLIAQKRSGKDLPQTLSPNMIPPSMKSSSGNESSFNDFSAIKELDKVSTEIENLGKEKVNLQQEISQTEDAIRTRKSEIEDLQSNLEKANKGLEILNQKKTELQKQLDDLDSEQCKLDDSIQDVLKKCEEEKLALKQLKSKLALQKSDVREQEQELHKGRKELEELRKEESLLEQQVAESSRKLEKLKNKVTADKNEALQIESNLEKLDKENKSLKEKIDVLTDQSSTAGSMSGGLGILPTKIDEDKDLFKHDPFGVPNTDIDLFNSDDPFKSDPFKPSFSQDPFSTDPFQNDDPFKSDPFTTSQETRNIDGVKSDPFLLDPFGSEGFSSNIKVKSKVGDEFSSKGSNFTSFNDESDVYAYPNKFSESSSKALNSNDPFSKSASTPAKLTSSEINSTGFSSSSDPFSTDPFGPGDPFVNSEDPFSSSATATAVEQPSADPFSSTNNDPFLSFTNSDPFSSTSKKADPFFDSSKDPFSSFASTNPTKDDIDWFAFGKNEEKPYGTDEDSQLQWATRESEREEQARKKRLKELSDKEEMEISLAIKQSVESSSDA